MILNLHKKSKRRRKKHKKLKGTGQKNGVVALS